MDLAAVSMSPLHFDRILGIEKLTPSHLVVSKLPKFRINLSWKPKKNTGLQPQKRMAPTKVRKRKRYLTIVAQAMLIGQVEDFPKGFPKVSCFIDSDDAFMVYRRFGTVFARLLLSKQDEIRRLEAKLQGMDKTDERSGDSEYLMSIAKDSTRDPSKIPTSWRHTTRTQLMSRLEKFVLEYCPFLKTLLKHLSADLT